MSYVKEVFEMLGVKPNEAFKVEDIGLEGAPCHISEYTYSINKYLTVNIAVCLFLSVLTNGTVGWIRTNVCAWAELCVCCQRSCTPRMIVSKRHRATTAPLPYMKIERRSRGWDSNPRPRAWHAKSAKLLCEILYRSHWLMYTRSNRLSYPGIFRFIFIGHGRFPHTSDVLRSSATASASTRF